MTSTIFSTPALIRIGMSLCIVMLINVIGCDDHKVTDQEKGSTPPTHHSTGQTPDAAKPERVRGIDISNYQGEVEWEKVESAGIGFAYMQATQGLHFVDPNFADNARSIQQTTLPYGSYHFFRPNHDADEQAALFLKTTQGHLGSLPPMLDIEVSAGLPAEEIGAGAKRWLEVVEQAVGCKPLVYSYGSFWEANLKETLDDYPLWLAEYAAEPRLPAGKDRWTIWQYSDKGRVPGIQGPVDLNYFNGDAKALQDLRCQQED